MRINVNADVIADNLITTIRHYHHHHHFLWVLLILLLGCGDEQIASSKGTIEGFPVEIQLVKTDAGRMHKALKAGMETIERRLKTAFDAEGELARLNKQRSLKSPSSEFIALLSLNEQFQKETNGAFEPRLGEVKQLWHWRENRPQPPEAERLVVALEKARATRVVLKTDEVALEGLGALDFGRFACGWAADGAYEAILSAGVTDGSIKVGDVTRYWGAPSSDFKWSTRIPDTMVDTMFYIITPDPGALAIIHPALNGFKLNDKNVPRLLDPKTGMPCDSVWALVVWSPSASEAGALSEALFAMGKRSAVSYVADKSKIGLLVMHGSGDDYAAESDPVMRRWIEVELP
ncbi:MAG: hypothetical protein FJY65_08720 [Calditrichaeota bacterium]|nr:hypothetical protein [Calditrichota bacterium]